MDSKDREELERNIANHLNELAEEMARRDEWLIGSIWNVVRSLNSLGWGILIAMIVIFGDFMEWWQIVLAVVVWQLILLFETKRFGRFEEDDKRKIGRDSILGTSSIFGGWWR